MAKMDKIGKAWKTFKGLVFCQLCLALTFIFTGLAVNAIQGFMYITIRPFNPRLYRKINYYVTYMLNSQIVFLVEWWSGSSSGMYSDPETVKNFMGKEHGLLLLNHGCEVDWIMGWAICDRVKVLGNARVYAKKILQWAPVLGWSWKFQEVVFLERDWEKDRKNLELQLTQLASYPDPIWLTLFPEGTRFTEEKHAASMKVAREKGLPELKHHLLPRTRGFTASVPYIQNFGIYDVVVAVDPDCRNEPSVFSLVRGKPLKTRLLLRRIPISEVPKDEKEAGAWLHRLYQQKDKVLDNFIRTGKFVPPGEEDKEEYAAYKNFKYMELPRRHYSLINFCAWAAIILIPLAWYIFLTLTSGSLFKVAVVVVLCAVAYFGFNYLLSLTKISKGSTYGKVTQPGTNGALRNGNGSMKSNGMKNGTNGTLNGNPKVNGKSN